MKPGDHSAWRGGSSRRRYAGLVDWARRTEGLEVVAVPRNASVKGFQVLPRRWATPR